ADHMTEVKSACRTTGDHKGPPIPAPPLSPLRTDSLYILTPDFCQNRQRTLGLLTQLRLHAMLHIPDTLM
ncbi:MAG TPA: hypothetical protein VKB35_05235, partial [Ktedonobacteraceae bacterium]|nr:hypothetical protein [Ktedonobacteraceae bacterium]